MRCGRLRDCVGVSTFRRSVGATEEYRVAPLSTPAWELRSRSAEATRSQTWSASLPYDPMPWRARLSIADIRISRDGEISPRSSKSESGP